MSQLRARVFTASIAAPLVLVVVTLLGKTGLSLFVLAVVLLGLFELHRMFAASGTRIYWGIIGLSSLAFAFLTGGLERSSLILLLTAIAIFLRGLITRYEPEVAMKEIVFSLFAVFLLPFFASFTISLRELSPPDAPSDFGLRLVVLLLIITWSSDTAAYFVGSRLGRHKALERISRDKTVEGFVGGACAATLSSVIFCAIFLDYFSLGQAALIGLVPGTLGQLGDFFVSLIKRAARQKDAGTLLPGHGGVLDRMDSFLFNAPLVYVLCKSLCDKL